MIENQRKWSDPIVWTHILFLINAVLYLEAAYYVLASTLFANCCASLAYHRTRETSKFWRFWDHRLCYVSVLLIFTYLICFSSSKALLISSLWLMFSLCIYRLAKHQYEKLHALWHGAVFVGNLIVWHCLR